MSHHDSATRIYGLAFVSLCLLYCYGYCLFTVWGWGFDIYFSYLFPHFHFQLVLVCCCGCRCDVDLDPRKPSLSLSRVTRPRPEHITLGNEAAATSKVSQTPLREIFNFPWLVRKFSLDRSGCFICVCCCGHLSLQLKSDD